MSKATRADTSFSSPTAPTALKHNPFGALGKLRVAVSNKPTAASKTGDKSGTATPTMSLDSRVLLRQEPDAEHGSIITRILGLAPQHVTALGAQLGKALGCEVAIEGRDLILMGAWEERAAAYLRQAGATHVVLVKPPASELASRGRSGGTIRAQIKRGLPVAIVQKADQGSGRLTEGVVREILTSASTHPRGIKVRLESGQVGRVQRILEP